MHKVILNAKRDYATLHRHPWIFSGTIRSVEGTPGVGETVAVCSAKGDGLGYGAARRSGPTDGRTPCVSSTPRATASPA